MRSTFGHHNCMHPRRHRLLSAHFLRHRWNLQARRVVAVHRRQVYPTPENSVTAGPDFASSSDFALSPDFALSSDFALGPDFAPCPSPDFAPSNSPLPTRQIVPVLLLPLYALPECASRYWEGDRVIYTLAYCMPLYSPSDRYDPADRSQRMHIDQDRPWCRLDRSAKTSPIWTNNIGPDSNTILFLRPSNDRCIGTDSPSQHPSSVAHHRHRNGTDPRWCRWSRKRS